MKKYTFLLWIAGLFLLIPLLHAQHKPPFLPSDSDDRCHQWVDSVMTRLSLQEKVGQLIVATIPAKATKENKKQIRELAKKYKVGGLLFAEGTPEEQAILTNLAQKNASVPVMVASDGEWGLSMRLKGTPDYPRNAALGCIEDNSLLEEYGREVARQFRTLGVHINFAPDADAYTNPLNPVIPVSSLGEDPKRVAEKAVAYARGLENSGVTASSLSKNRVTGLLKDEPGAKGLAFTDAPDMKGGSQVAQVTDKALPAGNDMVLVQFHAKNAVTELTEAVRSGILSKEELDAKCRKVLMYKYMMGLRSAQPKLQVSGMSYRINTEEAQALAAKLRCSAVTVLNNYFGILPLAPAEGGIALLSIGEKDTDAPFVEAMKKQADISCFYLPWNADDALQEEIKRKLATYRRVVVSITGSAYVSDKDVEFLSELDYRLPWYMLSLLPIVPCCL